jgi:hypothetical protein
MWADAQSAPELIKDPADSAPGLLSFTKGPCDTLPALTENFSLIAADGATAFWQSDMGQEVGCGLGSIGVLRILLTLILSRALRLNTHSLPMRRSAADCFCWILLHAELISQFTPNEARHSRKYRLCADSSMPR